jgi:hypothetical protein
MADTMIINGATCTVIYVDGSAGGGGDGLLPSTAFNVLPTISTIPSNTVIMCRRVSNVLTLGTGNFGATVDFVYYLGAPGQYDQLFNAAPANIKAGGDVDWCSEAGEYAVIKVTNNTDNHIFYKNHFGMSRIDFRFRIDQAGSGYVWDCDQESGVALVRNFFFTNMKIGVDGLDIHLSSYNTNFGYVLPGWCDMNNGTYSDSTFVFKHNTLTLGWYTSGSHFITGYYFRSVDIQDCTIYFAGYNGAGIGSIFEFISGTTTAGQNTERMRFEDITMYLIAQNYAYQGFPKLAWLYGNNMTLKNVSYTLQRYYTGAKSTITSLHSLGALEVYHGATVQIENVTADVTGPDGDGINHLAANNLIYLNGDGGYIYSSSQTAGESYIKNIIAKLADTSFASGPTPNGWALNMTNMPAVKIDNITSHHYRAPVGQGTLFSTSISAVIANLSLKGPANFTGITANVPGTWLCSAAVAANLISLTRSTVYINAAVLNAAWGTEAFCTLDAKSRLFVDNINVSVYYSMVTPGVEGWGVLACNNVQAITGNWQSTNYAYKGLAWNVHRVGGGQACIKLSKDNASAQSVNAWPALMIGPEMLRSMEYIPGATGMHTATVHVAYKAPPTGPTDPDGYWKRFRVIIEVPDDESEVMGRKEYVYSWIEGAWQSDSGSTWVNDTGLTQKKIVIPFNAVRPDLPVTVRVLFNWWDTLGNFVFYMDPIVEFAAL